MNRFHLEVGGKDLNLILVAQKSYQFINTHVNRFDWLKWFSFSTLGWGLSCVCRFLQGALENFTLFSTLNDSNRHLYQDYLKKCLCVLNQYSLNVNFTWGWGTKLSSVLVMVCSGLKQKQQTKATITVVFLELILMFLHYYFFLKLRCFLNSLFLFSASQFFCLFGEMLVEVLRLLHDIGLC